MEQQWTFVPRGMQRKFLSGLWKAHRATGQAVDHLHEIPMQGPPRQQLRLSLASAQQLPHQQQALRRRCRARLHSQGLEIKMGPPWFCPRILWKDAVSAANLLRASG